MHGYESRILAAIGRGFVMKLKVSRNEPALCVPIAVLRTEDLAATFGIVCQVPGVPGNTVRFVWISGNTVWLHCSRFNPFLLHWRKWAKRIWKTVCKTGLAAVLSLCVPPKWGPTLSDIWKVHFLKYLQTFSNLQKVQIMNQWNNELLLFMKFLQRPLSLPCE